VLTAGPDTDKINLLIVVKVQQAHLDDPERHVPGRDAIVILPRREPELTSADGHYWLPKAQVAKVYRLAGDDKALDIAVAKHMHDLAVAWSIDEAALAALTEFKGGELIVEGAEHLAFLWENGCLSKLATLDASGSRIGVEGGKALAPAIKASASLTSVSLDNSNLSGLWGKFEGGSRVTKGTYDATGINAIADALRVNASLTSLSMESNRIGAEGGVAIADALRVNASLTSVSLTNNKLCGLWSEFEGGSRVTKGTYDATGINAIADALRVNASLTSLRLNDNKLGPEGGKALAPGIAGSASLTELNVKGNRLGADGKAAIKEAVRGKEGFTLIIDGDAVRARARGARVGARGSHLSGGQRGGGQEHRDGVRASRASSSLSVALAQRVRLFFMRERLRC